MLSFYRKATAEDFKSFSVEYNNWLTMDNETKKFIENKETHKAIKRLREDFGFGMTDARDYCAIYEKFVNAKEDFEKGETVYVNY